MSDRHMNARPKRLTRKQKEALSAQGWDSRLYLCVRDGSHGSSEPYHWQDRYVPQVNPPREKE